MLTKLADLEILQMVSLWAEEVLAHWIEYAHLSDLLIAMKVMNLTRLNSYNILQVEDCGTAYLCI